MSRLSLPTYGSETMSLSSANEPSLEEILSSIRRIIAEDGPTTAAAAVAAPSAWSAPLEANDDVLLLTERAPQKTEVTPLEPVAVVAAPEPVAPPEAAETFEAPPAVALAEVEIPPADLDPTPVAVEDEPLLLKSPPEVEPVVAMDTEAKTAAAFEKLDAVANLANHREPSILMPEPGRTLEDVIREMMQPLLKEWLDENLPAIVQARVDEEIERIARRRVR
jgi:cell pole-organizing protein PopZ